ncbi:HtaA domain-containing protein [Corynebacterium sp. ES2715-CONJ3]|uniref:HtaA domain-containing protein n=1 Tax=Corynebacterium sp. ES2715-CONJ3 TaxID=2974028 RepID=UPI002166EE80|nr:HtaA domain-containing protein [Corynebacterium sp. ES2715-CONJ3]MCS4491452.1 HtaA domain-containing protein [Corynebacterium sp. ES2715-CONJ3]
MPTRYPVSTAPRYYGPFKGLVRSTAKSLVVIPALLGLLFLSAPTAMVPEAAAQTTCAMNWGVKKSFREYIVGPIAQGGWQQSSGIGFTGSPTGADSAFVFTPGKATIESPSEAIIPMQGVLKFQGHKAADGSQYLLDMEISDIKVKASGITAEIIADYKSYEADMTQVEKTTRGAPISGDDVTIAIISLNNAVNTESGIVDLGGTVTLAAGGDALFLNAYQQGSLLDSTSGTVKLDGSCQNSSTGDFAANGTTGGGDFCASGLRRIDGNFSGTAGEVMGMVSEFNDTMGAIHTLMCNSMRFTDTVHKFAGLEDSNRTQPANPNQQAAQSSTNQRTGTASGTTVTPGGVSDPSAPNPTRMTYNTAVCQAADARGIAQADARWGIKKSFQSYITGSIAKGSWSLAGVRYTDGQFIFSGRSGAIDPQARTGTIAFNGGVKFTGHQGVLNLQLTNPEIQFTGSTGQLVAAVTSSDTSGTVSNYGRVVVANLQFDSLDLSDSSANGAARVTLTAAGARAFAGFYEPGIDLDPLTFSATLKPGANCATGQGGRASAAIAGDSGSADSSTPLDGTQLGEVIFGEEDAALNSQGYTEGKSRFKIKNSTQDVTGIPMDVTPAAYALMALSAFVIAGGTLSRLVISHPAS